MNESTPIACAKCGKVQCIKPEWIGRKARCKACRFEFVIGESPDSQPHANSPAQAAEDDWLNGERVSVEDAFRIAVRQALPDGIVTETVLAFLRDHAIDSQTAKRIFDEEKAAVVFTHAQPFRTETHGGTRNPISFRNAAQITPTENNATQADSETTRCLQNEYDVVRKTVDEQNAVTIATEASDSRNHSPSELLKYTRRRDQIIFAILAFLAASFLVGPSLIRWLQSMDNTDAKYRDLSEEMRRAYKDVKAQVQREMDARDAVERVREAGNR